MIMQDVQQWRIRLIGSTCSELLSSIWSLLLKLACLGLWNLEFDKMNELTYLNSRLILRFTLKYSSLAKGLFLSPTYQSGKYN